MVDQTTRRYRWLLRAYPRWHRRLYGPDMLGTLLDADANGESLTPREALLLVLDGLRCRCRVRGAGALILALLTSLVAAGALGAGAGWVAWQNSIGPYLSVGQATAVAAPVLPAGSPDSASRIGQDFDPGYGRLDRLLIPVIGDPDPRGGGVYLEYSQPRDRTVRQARQSLTARGWHLASADGWALTADHAGQRIQLDIQGGARPGVRNMVVRVSPTPPALAQGTALSGAALGLLVGWLSSAALIAQARRRSPAVHVAATTIATIGTLISLPACLFSAVAMIQGAPPWAGYRLVIVRPVAALGAILLLTAAALASRVRDTRQPAPAAG